MIHISRRQIETVGCAMKLQVSYYKDTDTLSFWNGEPSSTADDVADDLLVDYNANGEAVGFTLEHAAETLLPLLKAVAEAAEVAREST